MAAGCRFSTFVEDLEHCVNNGDDGHDGHDDDCGDDGDRKLDGSNGSSNACVGANGMYNRLTHLDCWTVIMTVINQFSSAVNKALKIPIRSLCSSTSCHLRWLRTSSPTATKE